MRLRWLAVALDMDGTTLSSRNALTPRTVEAIRRADAAGLQVVIATGRPAPALRRYVDELALPRPVPAVCFNGACALFLQAQLAGQPPAPGRVAFSEGLGAEAAARVLALCAELSWCPSYCLPLGAVAAPQNEQHEELLREFEELEGVRQERVADCRALLEAGDLPLKIVAMATDPEASAAQARAALPEGTAHVVAAERHVEFLSPKVNKGRALVALCRETLGIAPEDVIAFGDNNNDIEMLQLVGEGVAMGNAKDAVKTAATRTCVWTNDDEGIARELEAMLGE